MSKSELAQRYLPYSSVEAAVKQLGRWIKSRPELMMQLAALGYRPTQKNFTPAQVKAITDILGEP